MGREARRVPLDFDWPQGEVWKGYITPDRLLEETCRDCNGSGSTPEGELLNGIAYLIAGLADDLTAQARGRDMHPYLQMLHQIAYVHDSPRPTEKYLEFVRGIDPEFRPDSFGIPNPYQMRKRLLVLAGLDEKWDWCPKCEGHGTVEKYPGQRAEQEAWEWTEPPAGEGWQMWETTSEGSPMSPVFETPQELAQWLADTRASVFGNSTCTYEEWLRMITGEQFGHEISPGIIVV